MLPVKPAPRDPRNRAANLRDSNGSVAGIHSSKPLRTMYLVAWFYPEDQIAPPNYITLSCIANPIFGNNLYQVPSTTMNACRFPETTHFGGIHPCQEAGKLAVCFWLLGTNRLAHLQRINGCVELPGNCGFSIRASGSAARQAS